MIGLRPPHLLASAFLLLLWGNVAAFGEDSASQKREEQEYKMLLATKTFKTANELFEEYSKANPHETETYGDDGLSEGARRSYELTPKGITLKPTGISEIGMERRGCLGTCPIYAVKITSDGQGFYFGEMFVEHLGMRTGKISPGTFQQLAEFIKDSGIEQMHSIYEDTGITDQATVYTSYVIDGKLKVISNYANSAPVAVWAVQELLDKIISEVRWNDSPSKK